MSLPFFDIKFFNRVLSSTEINEIMTITTTGRVGIGITNPSSKLDIRPDLREYYRKKLQEERKLKLEKLKD